MLLEMTQEPEGILLDWDSPMLDGGSPIQFYRVYRFVNDTREQIAQVASDATAYFDGDVHPESLYTYYVTAVNMNGESLMSNTASSEYPHCPVWRLTPPYLHPECIWPPPDPLKYGNLVVGIVLE